MFSITIPQAVGLLIAISLTVMLVLIGYQVIQILHEVKRTVEKANKILDDAARVSESVSEPVVALSGFLTGFKDGAGFIRMLADMKKKRSTSHDH